eukprot:3517335-Pleurochrysis_carterae.AAC.1
MLRDAAFEAKRRAGLARLRRDSVQNAYSECLAASAARDLASATSRAAAPAAATAMTSPALAPSAAL